MTRKMRARFIGQDGSIGYRTGQLYDLMIVKVNLFSDRPLIIFPQRCPYGSWAAFWRNWEEV